MVTSKAAVCFMVCIPASWTVACGQRAAITPSGPSPVLHASPKSAPSSSAAAPATPQPPALATGDAPPAAALPNGRAPVFPTRITTQEPRLGRDLNPAKPLLPQFTATPPQHQAHAVAVRMIDTVRLQIRAHRWTLETRTGCEVEADGDGFVEGRTLVRDGYNKVRAFSEAIGTGDSAAIWKYYYDDRSVLRAAVFSWRNYMGQKADGVMVFGESGQFVRCSSLPGDAGAIFCESKNEATEPLDPDVAAVTTAPAPKISESVAWVMTRDPIAQFQKCETPYRPAP
jgi:hypothetical protein